MREVKRENGSIAVYISVVILSMLFILLAVFLTSNSKVKSQIETTLTVKQSYEADNGKAGEIYSSLLAKLEPEQKEFEFDYTGSLQTFTAPANGVYKFELAGASGSGGNTYGSSYIGTGGKGAKIVATFTLKEGDIVDLVVGGQGTCTQATNRDGTAGGGGGGTFAFKRISTITDSRYQFTKGSINYETLLAVAGGGGSQDCAYKNTNSTGYDGQAASYKSPNNYTAYSATTNAGTSSSQPNSTMGISQFITYDAKGAYYSRNNGRSQGGYGGGGASDDNYSYGGGWCKGTSTYQSTSWSLDTSATGTDGANTGDGYAKITWIGWGD